MFTFEEFTFEKLTNMFITYEKKHLRCNPKIKLHETDLYKGDSATKMAYISEKHILIYLFSYIQYNFMSS